MGSYDPQEVSIWLRKNLDYFGYGTDQVKERRQLWRKISKAKTSAAQRLISDSNIERQHVGSQGTGISLLYESDTDILQTNNNVICIENLEKSSTDGYDDRIVFDLVREDAPAGYAFLRLSDKGDTANDYMERLKHALKTNGEVEYLSSKCFPRKCEDSFYGNEGYLSRKTVYRPQKGPSIPKDIRIINKDFQQWFKANEEIDFVLSFPCLCEELMHSWNSRQRYSKWPSQELRQSVQSLPGNVTAVGKKGSPGDDFQWRICFTRGEMRLLQSLNDTQIKVFIVLRHIGKHILKGVSHSITSYVIKNAFFWLCEEIPIGQFRPKFLIERLKDALRFLRSRIKKRSLPNYMIPERDLLRDKLEVCKQEPLLQTLTELLDNCEHVVIRLYDMEGIPIPKGLHQISDRTVPLLANDLSNYMSADMTMSKVVGLFTKETMTKFIENLVQGCSLEQYKKLHLHGIKLPYIRKYDKAQRKHRSDRGDKLSLEFETCYIDSLLPGAMFGAGNR